jgi:hypothetical protein
LPQSSRRLARRLQAAHRTTWHKTAGRKLMHGLLYPHLHLFNMACVDAPATCPQLGAEAESSGITSAWSAAALIAAQASSSTVTSQRLAAKESLRSFLKTVAENEWLSLCDEALHWIRGQPSSSSGKNGLLAASCALIEENALRCSDGTQPPQPAATNPLLSLCIARAVCSHPSLSTTLQSHFSHSHLCAAAAVAH